MVTQEKLIRATMRKIPGVGSQRLRQLIQYFGSALKAWEASDQEYKVWGSQAWIKELLQQRKYLDPQETYEENQKHNIKLVCMEDNNYPSLLLEIKDPPPILFYRGHLENEREKLAIVGSRKATPYGKAVATYFGERLAEQGFTVVSGLALGIDSAAHQGVINKKGITWAFLGCGLDRIYPYENRKLAEKIIEQGALISEYPIGTPPEAGHFPARNRLISGCSRGVIVIEAARKSGALITADFALEQGREVFAVPGPIFSEQSRGCHNLIKEGAVLVQDYNDIWPEISVFEHVEKGRRHKEKKEKENVNIDNNFKNKSVNVHKNFHSHHSFSNKEYSALLNTLSDLPKHIDEIIQELAQDIEGLPLLLLELELEGKILQLPGQYYVLAR